MTVTAHSGRILSRKNNGLFQLPRSADDAPRFGYD